MGLFPLDEIDQLMAAQKKELGTAIAFPVLCAFTHVRSGKKKTGDKKAAKKGNDAAQFIATTVREHHPQQVVVIGLGALTNIAEALALDPGIVTNMVRATRHTTHDTHHTRHDTTHNARHARSGKVTSARVGCLLQRLVYMGMGHRMKEAQTEDFPFKSPTDPFEPGHGQFPPPPPPHQSSYAVCRAVCAVGVSRVCADVRVCSVALRVVSVPPLPEPQYFVGHAGRRPRVRHRRPPNRRHQRRGHQQALVDRRPLPRAHARTYHVSRPRSSRDTTRHA
jgi:hypothetical protein